MVFFAKVVLVEEASAHACNAHKKSRCISPLSFVRVQCCMPRMAFQLGSRPGTWIVATRVIGRGAGGEGAGAGAAGVAGAGAPVMARSEFIVSHAKGMTGDGWRDRDVE
jgi:hypothetical protein